MAHEFVASDVPGIDIQPVTPNDSADLPGGAGVLVIAVGGSITVDVFDRDGVRQTRGPLTVPAGTLPCRVYRVHTGGTASGISVIYQAP